MTSRTPMGVQQRLPQRAIAGTSTHTHNSQLQQLQQSQLVSGQQQSGQHYQLLQQQQRQQNLAQQLHVQSPARRDSSPSIQQQNASDMDSPDSAITASRYGNMPRQGGSRLKTEVSSDSVVLQNTANDPSASVPMRILSQSHTMVASPGMLNSPGDISMSDASSTNNPNLTMSDDSPLPFPKRRLRESKSIPLTTKSASKPVASGLALKKDGRPRPWQLEIPPEAPKFKLGWKPDPSLRADAGTTSVIRAANNGFADFFPWYGNHPEDQMSESIIRQGYFDKPPATHTETGTARNTVLGSIKQKTGLNALSTIFASVMAQRRFTGQITSSSSFKLPPRVTLTDTKREIWLKDLANPAISLRKLSRTIPHGIRGKSLLEHCLNKSVPVDRAVWLAKCVGANEIRAFKRKGASGSIVIGGEAKWIRDWTSFVEQFVESLAQADNLDSREWKSRVEYATRFAACLYAEGLLDRDHYVEWLVDTIEDSCQKRLPIWLIITKHYWPDLLRSRKTGRRLVISLMSHLNSIPIDSSGDISLYLRDMLVFWLKSIMTSHPDCFISPTHWFKHKDALSYYLSSEDTNSMMAFNAINSRNSWLLASNTTTQPTRRQELIRLLDATILTPPTEAAIKRCWNLANDKLVLAQTLLEWGTSAHRPGFSKVYVAVRFLREGARMGIDVASALLSFLDTIPTQAKERKQSLYVLVSELVRHGNLVVSRYIAWLMTRGGLRYPSEVDPDGPCATRLLVELPLGSLDERTIISRENLLRRASYLCSDEQQDVNMALSVVMRCMGMPFESKVNPGLLPTRDVSATKVASRMRKSSRVVQTAVGSAIADAFESRFSDPEGPPIQVSTFTSARIILEAASDFSKLGQVLRSTSMSRDLEVLACCADTLNANYVCLAALDESRIIYDLLLKATKFLDLDKIPGQRSFLAAMASITSRIPGQEAALDELRLKLRTVDRTNTVDACSPVSDNMGAGLQDRDADLLEDIERLLASGTVADSTTIDRIFRLTSAGLEASWVKQEDERQRSFAILLARLRVLDTARYDTRMTEWLGAVMVRTSRHPLITLVPLLISLGSVELSVVVKAALVSSASNALPRPSTTNSMFVQEALQLTSIKPPTSNILTLEQGYRVYVQQQMFWLKHPKDLLILIRAAFEEYVGFGGAVGQTDLLLDQKGRWDAITQQLQNLVIGDVTLVSNILGGKPPSQAMGHLINMVTTRLLIGADHKGDTITYEEILEKANELTLPFCQLKLSVALTADSLDSTPDSPSQIDLFTQAMEKAIEGGHVMWTNALPQHNDDIAQRLKTQAQAKFLEIIPSARSGEPLDRSEDQMKMAESLLAVVDSLSRGKSSRGAGQMSPILVERLSDLWDLLLMGHNPEMTQVRQQILTSWLPAMLKFLLMHACPMDPSSSAATPTPATSRSNQAPTSTDVRPRLVMILTGILLELDEVDQNESCIAADSCEKVFDVALMLVDGLSEEAKNLCARTILSSVENPSLISSTRTSDSRIRYLLSQALDMPTDNILLGHRERPLVSGSGSAGRNLAFKSAITNGGSLPLMQTEKLVPFVLRRWEILSEPTPTVGENDTSISLTLFDAIKLQ